MAGSVQEQSAKTCGLRRVLAAWAAATPALQSLLQHWLRAGPGLCRYHCSLPSVRNSRGTWVTAWGLLKSLLEQLPTCYLLLEVGLCMPKAGKQTVALQV